MRRGEREAHGLVISSVRFVRINTNRCESEKGREYCERSDPCISSSSNSEIIGDKANTSRQLLHQLLLRCAETAEYERVANVLNNVSELVCFGFSFGPLVIYLFRFRDLRMSLYYTTELKSGCNPVTRIKCPLIADCRDNRFKYCEWWGKMAVTLSKYK